MPNNYSVANGIIVKNIAQAVYILTGTFSIAPADLMAKLLQISIKTSSVP